MAVVPISKCVCGGGGGGGGGEREREFNLREGGDLS